MSATAHAVDIVTLEMGGAIEEWRAFPDGAIHILLRLPVLCRCCGTEHAWYVNREGRTRCAECDEHLRRTGQEKYLVRVATQAASAR